MPKRGCGCALRALAGERSGCTTTTTSNVYNNNNNNKHNSIVPLLYLHLYYLANMSTSPFLSSFDEILYESDDNTLNNTVQQNDNNNTNQDTNPKDANTLNDETRKRRISHPPVVLNPSLVHVLVS